MSFQDEEGRCYKMFKIKRRRVLGGGGDSHMCFTAGHQLVGSSCSTFTMHFICRHALAGFSVLEEILFSEWH